MVLTRQINRIRHKLFDVKPKYHIIGVARWQRHFPVVFFLEEIAKQPNFPHKNKNPDYQITQDEYDYCKELFAKMARQTIQIARKDFCRI